VRAALIGRAFAWSWTLASRWRMHRPMQLARAWATSLAGLIAPGKGTAMTDVEVTIPATA